MRIEAHRSKEADPGILFVTRKWAPAIGGMELYSVRIAEAVARVEPVQLIRLPGKANGMPPGALALVRFSLAALGTCLRRRTAPRIVHIADMAIWPLATPALLWPRTRVVLSAHGTDVSYHRRGGLKGRLYGLYQRLGSKVLRRAAVIANSNATAGAAAELGWRVAAVVPLATDLQAPKSPGGHDRSILFVGRLIEQKGCAWFVREVLPLLPSDVRLKVAGTAWKASELSALTDARIEFLGPLTQDQLALAYGHALCVIVPNIELPTGEFEGFGLVACEAAACRGVVLAAKTGGLMDAVVDGETGFLLPPGDAVAWAAKIEAVSRWSPDQREAFLTTAQAAVDSRYRWDRAVQATLDVYNSAPAG